MRAKRKPKRRLGAAPRPVRRMGTELIADRRTRRARSRSDNERLMIEAGFEEMDDDR